MNIPTKYLTAEERRSVIVAAVVELAAEQNPNDITTSAIANRMGLTQGALFRHFPSKAAILEAVMAWVAQRLLSALDKALAGVSSPLAALEAMFMAHVGFVAEHPGVPRILFGELQRAEDMASKRVVRALIHSYGQRLRKLIAAGQECAELDANLDPEAAVILFIGAIQGLVMQALLAGEVGRITHDAPRVFAIYQRGIRRSS